VNGIPVECWDGVAPDPVPVLWLKPESLDGLGVDELIPKWPDSSVYENHARQADPEFRPTKSDLFGFSSARSDPLQSLSLLRPIQLRYYWTLFFVWDQEGVISNPFLRSDLLQGLFRWQPSQWRHPNTGTRWIVNWPPPPAVSGFGMIQREGLAWKLQRNGDTLASFSTLTDEAISFQAILPLTMGSFGPLASHWFELKVFDSRLSDAQTAAEVAYFQTKYGF